MRLTIEQMQKMYKNETLKIGGSPPCYPFHGQWGPMAPMGMGPGGGKIDHEKYTFYESHNHGNSDFGGGGFGG